MRKQITLYDDMYNFYRDTKSKRLLVAFVEYLFEWIEPTDLKWIENTIRKSLKIRMENQRKKADSWAIWWANSSWGGRKGKASSELKQKTSKKQAKQQTNEQTENKEDILSYDNILSNISSYEDIYSAYYWKRKWIDEWVCRKQIDKILKQWTTLTDLNKCMVLYNCECRLKQERTYVMKLETWLKQFQPLTDEEIESWLCEIAKTYKSKLNTDPKFQTSSIAKDTRNELTNTFGEEKIREIWKREWRKQINLITN